MRPQPSLRSTIFLLLLFTAPANLQAQSTEAIRKEARERFDRGLTLFNQGDNAGALAEYKRTYELIPNPQVLYNIAIVYAAMGRSVDALAVLEKLSSITSGLKPEQVTTVAKMKEEQKARVGEIAIVSDQEGASIEVDGIESGKTPSRSIPVTIGTHLVTVSKPGFVPVRREILVASQSTTSIEVKLQPTQEQLAKLSVGTKLLDVEVVLDDLTLGRTPLLSPLTITPGKHTLRLQRKGYVPVNEFINASQGDLIAVNQELQLDEATILQEGGELSLLVREREVIIFIDGKPRGEARNLFRLAPGRHLVRVERNQFFPFERIVTVEPGRRSQVIIELEPTPEFRDNYARKVNRQRFWGYTSLIAGSFMAVGGGVFVAWNKSEESDKKQVYDALVREFDPGQRCDPKGNQQSSCIKELDIRASQLNDIRAREKFGWIGVGIGVATGTLGAVLLLTSDDPRAYGPKPESDVFGRLYLAPWGGPGSARGLTLGGEF